MRHFRHHHLSVPKRQFVDKHMTDAMWLLLKRLFKSREDALPITMEEFKSPLVNFFLSEGWLVIQEPSEETGHLTTMSLTRLGWGVCRYYEDSLKTKAGHLTRTEFGDRLATLLAMPITELVRMGLEPVHCNCKHPNCSGWYTANHTVRWDKAALLAREQLATKLSDPKTSRLFSLCCHWKDATEGEEIVAAKLEFHTKTGVHTLRMDLEEGVILLLNQAARNWKDPACALLWLAHVGSGYVSPDGPYAIPFSNYIGD